MRDLKILILINSLGGGGAERVALNLATEWRDAGADVVVATLQSDEYDVYPVPQGIRRVSLDISGRSRSILSIVRNNIAPLIAIRRLLRRERPDIAIGSITIAAIGLALARTGDVIAIGHEHGNPAKDFGGRIAWMWNFVRRLSYARLDAVVALVPQSAAWFKQNTLARKAVAIPNSTNLPLPNNGPKIKPEDIVLPEKRLLLAVGRLHPYKRFDRLLDAFAHINDRHSNWQLVILGEGDLRIQLEAQIDRLGLTGQVHLPGFAGNVADWYQVANAFALTSDTEGFGMVLIEAMAHGCPVISVDCPMGPRNIIRSDENGLLVPMDDFDALVDGLDRMLSNDALRTRLASSAFEVLETYSPARVNDLWQNFFDKLVQNRNAQAKSYRCAVASATRPSSMRDLKILILINSLGGGGAERVALNLATEWHDTGADVVVATLQSDEHDVYPVPQGIRRVSLDISGRSRSILSIVRNNIAPLIAIRRLLRRERPDIAVGSITIAAIGLALARTGDVIAIGHEHLYPTRDFVGWNAWMWNFARRLSYARLDAVIALTPQSAEWLRENTRARKIIAIPNSTSLPLPHNEPRVAPEDVVPVGSKLLLAIGRLHPQKRFDRLLDAFAHIKNRHSNWHLVILGEGEMRDELESQIARLDLAQHAHLSGFVGNVADWYQAADALALTSDYEGFGMVLVEAMAHGCPVISVDCDTGPRDIIRSDENGLLVPMDDFDALVDGLDKMLSDDALRTRLASNATEVAETYSPARINAHWRDLFDQLMPASN